MAEQIRAADLPDGTTSLANARRASFDRADLTRMQREMPMQDWDHGPWRRLDRAISEALKD